MQELLRRWLGLLVIPAVAACGEDPRTATAPPADPAGPEVPPPVVHAPPVPLPVELLDGRWGAPADAHELAIDPAGTVWVATRHTLHVRPPGKRFFEQVPPGIGLPERKITALGALDERVVLVGHEDGPVTAVLLDEEGGMSAQALDVTGYVHSVRSFASPAGPVAVVAGAMGLAVVAADGSVVARRAPDPAYEEVWAAAVSPDGDLWFATYERTMRIPGGALGKLGVPVDPALDLIEGTQDRTYALDVCPDGGVWAATLGNGVLQLDAAGGQVARFDKATSLPQDHVISIACDPEGGVWMGTSWGGIARLLPDGSLDYHTHDVGLPGDSIRAIVPARDAAGDREIWFATEGGLGVYRGR